MTYKELMSRFNGEMPDYFEDCFEGFDLIYDRHRPVLTDEEINAVEEKIAREKECFDIVREVRDAMDSDDLLHAAASFLKYVLCDARFPWENRLWKEDSLLIGEFKNEQVNLVFVVAQLAKTLLVRKPPEDLNEENINAFRGYTRQCYDRKGYWGVNEFSWNMLCAGGCMFMCGALKFCPSYFTKDFASLEKDGEYISIVCGSYGVNKYGEITKDGDEVFKTSYTETDEGFLAHRVTSDGIVQPQAEFFAKSEYNVFLGSGSHTIDFHIPTGMTFTPEVVKDAFERAVSFYSSFYPEHKTKAITVYSWLFSPQMRLVAGEGSNILAVQRNAHLLPVTETFDDKNRFIRPDSSLARRISEVCRSGRKFHIGIAYFPVDKFNEIK